MVVELQYLPEPRGLARPHELVPGPVDDHCVGLLQAIVVAGIGYAIGIGLCAGFFEITSRISINLRGFELPWQVAAGTACAILVIIVIASFASIRKVMVVDPAIVFRG